MKKIKILALLLLLSAALFYSCTDSNPIEDDIIASKSIALRTTLNEVKKAYHISGKDGQTPMDQFFCFNFVYPITLSYNNGTEVTVTTLDGLLEILRNETNNLYIEGIVFPFQVQEEMNVTTINNEAEFFALIQECTTFTTVNDFVFDFNCYSIAYPISIIDANGTTVIINNQTELMQLLSTPAGGTATYQLNIVFPITVIQNNQNIVIADLYEFFQLNNACNSSACLCPAVYEPVCVYTPARILHYSNACFAECDGYAQSDFVDCNSSCPCPANVDPVCVMSGTGPVQFDNACLAECAGFTSADFITCGVAPTDTFGNYLGSCFTIHYPVQIQSGGALVTVNNDSECLQYWFPAQSQIPAFNYPIIVTFGSQTTQVGSQMGFETFIDIHCN